MMSALTPTVINSLATLYKYCTMAPDAKDKDKVSKVDYNASCKDLLNTVFAVAAYVATVKFGSRFGIDLPKAACLLALPFPEAAQLGIAGHLFYMGARGTWTAGRAQDVVGIVKNVAVVVFAYASTTPAFKTFCDQVYGLLPEYNKG
jgi:hypothetical protein